jgi:sigma-B regulation protein RsbU (phosphoserine phosphatase)
LRRIEAVTDVALSKLDLEDLLAELLERIRDLLSADTAAVLLLEDSAPFLVATAARGIEEEVAQGVQVPSPAG